MEKQNLGSFVLILSLAGLLLWNGLGNPIAPPGPAAAEPEPNGHISVSGSSAIRIQPDRIVVLFGIESFTSSPSSAQAENARRSRAVMQAIRGLGIAERDIATADFSLQPRYDDYEHYDISGYLARNTIAVTLRDVRHLEPVLVTALEAGATTVNGVEFSVTNLRELRDRAREQAVQAALEKACDMASAAGLEVGSVTSIHEQAWNYFFGSWNGNRQWTSYQNVVQDLSAEGALVLEDGSISLGQIVVSAEVSLTAELVEE
jgi:hypothetical protein